MRITAELVRRVRAATTALFLLAFLVSPLHAALPSGTAEGHQHMLSHEHGHDHHDEAGAGEQGEHEGEGVPAPEEPGPSGAVDHSHPVSAALIVGELRFSPAARAATLHEAVPGRRAPSLLLSPPHRPPSLRSISA